MCAAHRPSGSEAYSMHSCGGSRVPEVGMGGAVLLILGFCTLRFNFSNR